MDISLVRAAWEGPSHWLTVKKDTITAVFLSL